MAIILNIETATDICSICISRHTRTLAKAATGQPFEHAARITRLIEDCLRTAGLHIEQLDAIAVSQGPGSYTALRIGISAAKGIAYALGKPLIAVDTLQALALATAFQTGEEGIYRPMIDARRMEVYTRAFDRQGRALGPAEALVIRKDSFAAEMAGGTKIILSGNGAAKCKTILPEEKIHFADIICDSEHLVPLALRAFQEKHFADLASFIPFYLKPPNITTAKKKL